MDQLLDEGSLRPAQANPDLPGNLSGRPAQYFELNPSFAHFIGVEIGVRRVRLLARDFQGRARHTETRVLDPTERHPDAVCDQVTAMVRNAVRELCWTEDGTLSLGFTVPGTVDRTGTIVLAPILEWRNVSLGGRLRAAFPEVACILFENDSNAFAMAEIAEGALIDESHAIALWFDVGVGGAILAEGRLARGAGGFAGEFGHMLWHVESEKAGCRRARVEDMLGRDGLIAEIRELSAPDVSLQGVVQRLGTPGAEVEVSNAVLRWTRRCAAFVASLSSAFNPGIVVLGGPMSELLLGDLGPFKREIEASMFSGDASPKIVLSRIGPTAPAVGVTVMLREMLIEASGVAEAD